MTRIKTTDQCWEEDAWSVLGGGPLVSAGRRTPGRGHIPAAVRLHFCSVYVDSLAHQTLWAVSGILQFTSTEHSSLKLSRIAQVTQVTP